MREQSTQYFISMAEMSVSQLVMIGPGVKGEGLKMCMEKLNISSNQY